jgi:KipI family sensor histidine kinase inhibitor
VGFGDAAILVELGDRIDRRPNARIHDLARRIRLALPDDDGFGRPVPAYASLLVPFDPARLTVAEAQADVEAVVVRSGAASAVGLSAAPDPARWRPGRLHRIAVRYGGGDGPDLAEVAARVGLSEAAVIELHAGTTYDVYMLGFVPGFPYLGILPAELTVPRRATPRTSVRAGSVAIAERQTAIYPLETPGGWHLLGRTTTRLWDPAADPPALLAPGDRVRFVPA